MPFKTKTLPGQLERKRQFFKAASVFLFSACLFTSIHVNAETSNINMDKMALDPILFVDGRSPFSKVSFITINGIVLDAQGNILPGVSVLVKGSQKGTSTLADGRFSIDANKGDVLEFSIVGYKSNNVRIESAKDLTIVMEIVAAVGDEVVVVGYGTQKKTSVVSAISTVKGGDLRMSTRSLSNNLAGQVAGLIAIKRSGEPGYDNSEFWIRGISTFAGGSTPLVLVDGVPRSINDIEPDEIETFSILKDAAATAVYGAEGANGVVLVTSKRGRIGKPVISFRTEHSASTPTRLPQFVSSDQYLKLYNEALSNDGQAPIFSDELIGKYENNVDPDLYPNTNWIKEMLRDKTENHRYTLNVRGGSERAKFFVSGSYYSENGIFKDDPTHRYENNIGLQRYNLRSNIDLEVSNTTKIGVDLSGQYLMTNYPGTGTDNIFRQMLISPSYVFPAIYSDGTLSTYEKERDGNMKNPYNLLMNSGYAKEWRSSIQSTVKLDQNLKIITRGLSYRAMVSYDYNGFFSSRRNYNPSRYFAKGKDANGKLLFSRTYAGTPDLSDPTTGNSAQKNIYLENSLNYNRNFNKHVVGGMILYMQKETQDYNNALAYRKQGMVGRGTYSFDDKYFVEGNFGYTGSETFSKGYRFGFFPAVGLGYMVSNEAFYPENLKNIISTLKLRASVGRTGNDKTGAERFLYRPTFGFGSATFQQGITSGGGANGYGNGVIEGRFEAPYLTWEIENKRDLGLNLGLLGDKIQIAADYFSNERTGILLQRRTVPGSAGFRTSPWQNFGSVEVWGMDGSLDANYTFNEVKVGARGTFTFSRNKITEFDELPQPYSWMKTTGTRIGENVLYIADGLYTPDDFIITQNTNGTKSYKLKDGLPVPTLGGLLGPGDIKYKDLNGDGKIDQFDRQRGIGNPFNPEIIYGMGLNVQYKGFYASVFFQGAGNTSTVLGNNAGYGWLPFQWGVDQSNYRSFALDRYVDGGPKSSNDNPMFPRLHMNGNNQANNFAASTYWLRDASFLRLKNMEIGYNFSKELLDKVKIKTARVYLMGYNLAVWDKIKIWDPESGNATGGNAYPANMTFTIGLETTF